MIALAPCHYNQMRNYLSWFKSLNVSYYILNPDDEIDSRFSILILSGGPDVHSEKGKFRDINETRWFKEADRSHIPVLGVCRGIQLVNVILGGDLQLIENHSSISQQSSFHEISYKEETFEVNSRHRYAIKTLAPGLVVTGKSDDGIMEMTTSLDERILLVQWHPERPDVRGARSEQIVSEWIKKYIKGEYDPYFSGLSVIGNYINDKSFSMISEERLQILNEDFDREFLNQLILKYPKSLRNARLKNSIDGIQVVNWKEPILLEIGKLKNRTMTKKQTDLAKAKMLLEDALDLQPEYTIITKVFKESMEDLQDNPKEIKAKILHYLESHIKYIDKVEIRSFVDDVSFAPRIELRIHTNILKTEGILQKLK